jgi:hypothetical protein
VFIWRRFLSDFIGDFMKLLAKDALRISHQIDDTMRDIEAAVTFAARRGETAIVFPVPTCQIGAVAQTLHAAGYKVTVNVSPCTITARSVTISWDSEDN